MAEVTYYFNSRSTGNWTDPDYMIDGILTNYAYTASTGTTETLNGNTCPGSDLGTILKVEIRVYGYGDADDLLQLTPVFAGGDGDLHSAAPGTSPVWSAYYDITEDTNAPSPWTWAAVQNLDCKVIFTKAGKGNTMHCSRVEIRVTYWAPPEADIDVGAAPIDRTGSCPYGDTRIDKNNPANATGTIKSVKVYAAENISGFRVGTFYPTNGDTLKCRASAVIGDVTAGSEQTFTELSIAVQEGDYIGCYFTAGKIEFQNIGGDGGWIIYGEYIDPDDEATYTFYAGYAISLYGYGDTGGPAESIVANSFPMEYLESPAKAEELKSKVSGATVSNVAKDFPETLIRGGKAKELRSKWS